MNVFILVELALLMHHFIRKTKYILIQNLSVYADDVLLILWTIQQALQKSCENTTKPEKTSRTIQKVKAVVFWSVKLGILV